MSDLVYKSINIIRVGVTIDKLLIDKWVRINYNSVVRDRDVLFSRRNKELRFELLGISRAYSMNVFKMQFLAWPSILKAS